MGKVNRLIDDFQRRNPGRRLTRLTPPMEDEFNNKKVLTCNRIPPLHVYNVAGDGNCFYRSISHIITGTDKYHGTLRTLAADYLAREDPNDPESLIHFAAVEDRSVSVEDARAQVVREMATDRTKANNLDLRVMASMLELKVVVYMPIAEGGHGNEYSWAEYRPKPGVNPISVGDGFYIYWCGMALERGPNPNHFVVVKTVA